MEVSPRKMAGSIYTNDDCNYVGLTRRWRQYELTTTVERVAERDKFNHHTP
jgi:hypothetical protein